MSHSYSRDIENTRDVEALVPVEQEHKIDPLFERIEYMKRYVPFLNEIRFGYTRILVSRMGILLVMLTSSLWLMSATVVYAGIRAPDNVPDLPDLGFQLLPSLYEKDSIGNSLLGITGAFTFLRCMFHRRGITMIRRFLFLWMVLIIGRCTTLVATSYPDPSRACRTYKAPVTIVSFLLESVYRPEFITCGDLMYSGHTVYFTLMGLLWSYYAVYSFEKLVWIPIGLSLLILVATRLHYLNDVLIAFYLTILCWYLYHIVATENTLRKHSRLISWLEEDIIMWEEQNPQEQKNSYRCLTENSTVIAV